MAGTSPRSDVPAIVIISGPPGAGKTTIGRRLAADLRLPFISKDDIKELLFEHLGWQDREWSMKLGKASFFLLYYMVEIQLRAGQSSIIETVFHPELSGLELEKIRARLPFRPIQIYCRCDDDVLYERYHRRTTGGDRHPGHVDASVTRAEYDGLVARLGPLPLNGPLLEIDTTDLASFDYEELRNRVKPHLSM